MNQKSEDYKKELVTIFFAQKEIILFTTLLIFSCSILIGLFWPPTFAAYGAILVKGKKVEKSPDALERETVMVRPLSKEDLFSEVQILTSPDVLAKTIQSLKDRKLYSEKISAGGYLAPVREIIRKTMNKVEKYLEDRYFLPGGGEPRPNPLGGKDSNEEVRAISSNLKTAVSPASNVINLSFYHGDPDFCVAFLATLMEQYITYRVQIYNPLEAKTFFSNQVDKFEKALGEKSDELMRLVEKTGMSDPLKEIENNLAIKKDLELKLNVMKEEAIGKKSSILYLEKTLQTDGIQYFSFLEGSPIHSADGLSSRLQQLVNERGNVARVYNEESDRVKTLDRQIAEQYARLKREIEKYKENQANELYVLEEKIKNLEEKITGINDRNIDLKRQHLLSERINTETKLLLDSFETFSKRKEEATISSSGAATNFFISILKAAFPSNGPVFPKKGIVIPLGLLAGFMTGCGLGFMREYFDHTFKKPSDAMHYAGVPLIFSIPELEGRVLGNSK